WAKRDTKQIPIVQVPVSGPQPVVHASGPYEPIDPISEPVRAIPPPPPPPSGAYAAQPVAKPKPPPAPARPPQAPPPIEPDDDDEPKRESSSTPWVIFLLVIVIAASGYFAWSRANAPFEPARQDPIVDADPTPVRTVEVDAGAAAPAAALDAGDDAGVEPIDAGAAAPVAPVDAGPALPAELSITIDANPNVELSIDGAVVGRTPWTGQLAMGQHKLKLENKDLLINSARSITVQGDQPISQTYTFTKGAVAVTAPAGATIFIDGKKQGVAPLPGELQIYEGFHRILVKVGQAQWTETFTLFEGQRVNFNVELE
ncbi:MAG: PEGA domain-containing protein, partial [Archangium sp.]|nr:PEGA domain-containing protein [Archangium sp.]